MENKIEYDNWKINFWNGKSMSLKEWESFKKQVDEQIAFWKILSPINKLVEWDTVLLFYNNPQKIYEKLLKIYQSEDWEKPFHLGYEKPELVDYKFMGEKYQAISLWYDWEEELAKSILN